MAPKRPVSPADISALTSLLPSRVHPPSSPTYPSTLVRWSRAAEKQSGLSVLPTSAEEVSAAVSYATAHGIDLAVKGGGHSTAGASSTHGGVLISLDAMRAVRVDPATRLIHVQGGATWGDVDAAAWEHGLAAVGGTVADTGVGGLTLGGGYGTLSGLKGLVTDSLVEATVVLASGEILRASESENEGLFWALRGAGQNFGVTTEFVFRGHPQGEVFTGELGFVASEENIDRLVRAVNGLYESGEDGGRCASGGKAATLLAFVRPPPAGGKTVVLAICTYLGPETEGREVFKEFFEIGPIMDQMRVVDYPTVNKLVPAVIGKRSSMKGAAFVLPLRTQFVAKVLRHYDEFMDSCKDAGDSLVAFELYDPTEVVARDEGCFANRGYHLNGLVMPTWSQEENDAICRQWARDVSNLFKEELEVHGKEPAPGIEGGASVRGHKGAVLLYGNYDQYDEKSKDIFGSNYERLQALKAKYDPTNMFNKLFPIQPLEGNGSL